MQRCACWRRVALGGQSNMEWKVQESIGEAIRSIRHCLRRCDVSVLHRMSAHPEADLPTKWIVSTAESAQGFTVIGAWLATKVGLTLDVPVGILSMNRMTRKPFVIIDHNSFVWTDNLRNERKIYNKNA